MRKKLIFLNGTMGVGKSTTCQWLLKMLSPSVYLDGDWCWMMNPFIVSEENKQMVLGNITHLLTSYLEHSAYEYIIFCWVMHEESIVNAVLAPLSGFDFILHQFTLTCSEDALKARLLKDVKEQLRAGDIIDQSLQRLCLYDRMDTTKIDVTDKNAKQAADEICKIVLK
jgi:broad-specificity NMP kinase